MLLQQAVKYILKISGKIRKGKMFEDSILLFLKDVCFLLYKGNCHAGDIWGGTFAGLECA